MKKLLLLLFIFLSFHVFAQQPNCEEVPELIHQAKIKLQEDASSSEARKYLRIALESEPMNEEVNYLLAKSHLNDAPSHYVLNYINKALASNPNKIAYRWIRVQTLMAEMKMLSGIRTELVDQALEDLNFLIAQESEPGKAYLLKGSLYNQLGDDFQYKRTDQANEEMIFYKTAINYYKDALDSVKMAVNLNESNSNKIDTRAIEFKISKINDKISQL